MSASVGSTIRLTAVNGFDEQPVLGATWTVDPATAANGTIVPGSFSDSTSCTVKLTAVGPVRVINRFGGQFDAIVVAATSDPAPGKPLSIAALNILDNGVYYGAWVPDGLTVINTAAAWLQFCKALGANGDFPPGTASPPPPPVDLGASSLVVVAATYSYPYVPLVLTHVGTAGSGIVDAVQTQQSYIAPPPAVVVRRMQVFQTAKLPNGAQTVVACGANPACGSTYATATPSAYP